MTARDYLAFASIAALLVLLALLDADLDDLEPRE